ncbi:hypothetical protein BHM03_00006397 [Ensete ventricosum]|nr:hypothetical protein BHM03_00006397 [Ensete ventricosum]
MQRGIRTGRHLKASVGEARRLHGDIVKPRLDAERRLAVFGGEKQGVDLVRRAPYRVAFGPFVDGENTKRGDVVP